MGPKGDGQEIWRFLLMSVGGGVYHFDIKPKGDGVDHPGGASKEYIRDSQFNPVTVTNARGYTTKNVYDAYGKPLTVINAKNEATLYTYDDVFHQVTSVKGPLNPVTRYSYDANGNLLAISSDSPKDGRDPLWL
jgi:YD repeat-containing protein